LVFAVPPPTKTALRKSEVEKHVRAALALAKRKKIEGKAVTPFLLGEMVRRTKGKALAANLALLENNARTAAKIAVALGWR
jgi:pseudouridine-5'-phosphate glycosidase